MAEIVHALTACPISAPLPCGQGELKLWPYPMMTFSAFVCAAFSKVS